ncbi:hypothetical protein [Brucella haematophila]|uniref:Uncharacterized protein n=1 Tax=Brucella haematophila TaxID=419474 RepID=A0ABX1DP87_9HYPH|nr:hypothetical protein [Brucella haematophila]NKC04298.1 hypothetical protein [Brucella haematophila]TMV06151.1 hypothetical protein FGI60_02240 [Brucella haematophila]
MEPVLESVWQDERRGTEYLVVRIATEDMASRCKDGDQAYLWGWSDTRDAYSLIANSLRNLSNTSTLFMKIPVSIRLEDDTARWGTIVVYQDRKDNRLWAEYADEFLDGRYKKLSAPDQ